MGQTKLKVEPECLLTVAMMLCLHREKAVGMTLLFMAVHELGHALVYTAGGGKLRCICVTPFGVRMEMGTIPAGDWWEMAAVAAGPAANLIAAGIAFGMGFRNAGTSGMVLGLYNLIPAQYLDGGYLVELIAEAMGSDARRFTKGGSLLLCVLLGGLFLFSSRQGVFLQGLFLAFLLSVLEFIRE